MAALAPQDGRNGRARIAAIIDLGRHDVWRVLRRINDD
jgi:hypothetical protein